MRSFGRPFLGHLLAVDEWLLVADCGSLTNWRGSLIRLLLRRFLSGNFNRVGYRSASGHLFNADPVEDWRTPFSPLSGDTSRLPPHGATLQNFESVRARALMLW